MVIHYCQYKFVYDIIKYGGDTLTIAKGNKRVIITVPNDVYDEIKDVAAKENRSISNFIVTKIIQLIAKEKEKA
jgi:hypothetical protein